MKQLLIGFVVLSLFGLGAEVKADTSNISNLVFTSDSQTIKPGTLSGEIKVQAQNSSGSAEAVSETNDVTFTSTSPTGEFLNTSGNAVTKTMNKNTSSRTFYYRDSTAGVFELTVSIKGRESGTTFTAKQNITISNSVIIDEPDTDTSTTTASTTQNTATQSSTVTTAVQALSSHSNTRVITYIPAKPEFMADAGRQRLTTTNASVEFEANESGFEHSVGRVSYSWSFGDGQSATGKLVQHSYVFPGDYIVVLNISNRSNHAVSRTEVKVVEPKVQIVDFKNDSIAGNFVELKNNSNYEVNIQDWRLVGSSSQVVFPEDTIIKANTSIKIPFTADTQSVTLFYANGVLAHQKNQTLSPLLSKVPIMEQDYTESYINTVEQDEVEDRKVDMSKNNIVNDNADSPPVDTNTNTSTTTSVIEVFEASEDLDENLIASPQKLLNFLKDFFTK